MKELNKMPCNNQNQPHGYWLIYYTSGRVMLKGSYINGVKFGYWYHGDNLIGPTNLKEYIIL